MMQGALRTACVVILTTFLAAAAGAAAAQPNEPPAPPATPASEPLTVGLYVSPPFVMKEGGRFTGMAIDLWEMLASNLGWRSRYVEIGTISELVDAAAAGKIDVAITNLTITKERAEHIDFTHSWFDAGLRIMVNDQQGTGFGEIFRGLRDAGHLRAYAWIAFVILVATVLLTLFDRYFDRDFPRRWRDGVAESFYTVMSVATSGRPPARKNLFGWVGRIWQGLWLVCGVAVLAYATSSVTSVMTTLSLTNQINSVADLPGRPVGVFTGSIAEQYVRQSHLDGRPFDHIDEAAQALIDGRISAIVGDAPVLEYFAHTNPRLPVKVVGAIFQPDKYGLALPRHSTLTRPLTIELIGARQSGQIQQIRRKYFGESP